MVNISIDVTDLGGEARPGDKVVFWRPRMGGSATHAGRVISTAPVTVFLTNGKATVSDVEPGEMTVLLQCRGVESQGPVTVGVPDGGHTVTLRALLESQFEYAPPIVSAVQEAASNASASEEAAIQAQVRSEAAADRAEDRVDDAINNGANLIRNEVKQDADRAVSARQAATQSESNAAASEGAAASSASNAAASESSAKQSETNAGDYAAVATTAATEAVDAMERATDLAGGDFATREYVDSKNWVKRDFASGEDLNEVTDPGIYTMPHYSRANSLINRPTESYAVDRGVTEVLAGGRAVQQTWYPMGVASRTHMPVMRRRRDNGGTWTEWEQINAKVDVPDYDPLEAVGMTATGASGELTGLRSVLRDLTPGAAPVWAWWAPAPTTELEMATHDGGGQTCHPSVLYFPSGWNGWKYWMVHTPYPNFKEAHEDPNIAVSNDGTTWQVPEGLTNPLDDGLGRPNYHNSDGHLAMWGDTMVVTWRTVDRPNGGQNIIYARTSTDGVNWTDKTEVLKVPLGNAESTFVAQSLVKMPTGWRLYGIRSNYGPNRLGYYETSVNTIPKTSDWGAAQDCDLGEIPTGRDPWHSEVQRLSANDWVAVISDGKRGSTGVDGDIYLATSTDGVEWDVSPLPLTPRANGVINSLYKTGFVVSGTGANRTFDLWVSGYRTDKRTWGIYRTLAEYRGSNQAETLPVTRVGTGSPEGKVAAPVGSVYTDTAATNGAVRWVKTSGTGNTGWRVEYGDTGWRNLSSLIPSTWAGEMAVTRTGNRVTIIGSNIRPGETGDTHMLALPAGFRPSRTTTGAGVEGGAFRPIYAFGYPPYNLQIRSITAANSWANFSITYVTQDAWPNSLSGTPL